MLLCKNRRLFAVSGDNSHVLTPIPMHLIPIPIQFPSHGWSYSHSHGNPMGPMGSQSSPFPCTPLLLSCAFTSSVILSVVVIWEFCPTLHSVTPAVTQGPPIARGLTQISDGPILNFNFRKTFLTPTLTCHYSVVYPNPSLFICPPDEGLILNLRKP